MEESEQLIIIKHPKLITDTKAAIGTFILTIVDFQLVHWDMAILISFYLFCCNWNLQPHRFRIFESCSS